jgi:nucleoside-diphosphate-sugar epimerase
VLVTGGAGFIGRHLVNRLLQDGNDVIVFDVPGAPIPLAWQGRVRVVAGDIANAGDVQPAVQGAGMIFHTAAVVSDWAPAAEYERVNLQGSRHVFEAAAQQRARVLLLSSCAVYGDLIGRQELREDRSLGRPIGRYGLYKQRQEALGWQYQSERGLALTVVRPSKVYGPGSRPWVHEVAQVLQRGRPCLIDGGNYNPGLVYVDNLVELLMLAAARPEALGRVYNGYDGTTVTLRQYFTDLAAIVGARPPRSMPRWFAHLLAAAIEPTWRLLRIRSRPLLTRDSLRLISSEYTICLDRVRGELGFAPRVSYAEGLRRVEAYWRDYARR